MSHSSNGHSDASIGQDEPFLAPIEHPKGLITKLAYAFTRRQFGKVLTPVKVAYSRLPPAFVCLPRKSPSSKRSSRCQPRRPC
jgi:hypothetical protein